MKKSHAQKFDQLLGFMYRPEGSISQMSQDLESLGISVAELDASVQRILSQGQAQPATPQWLERARTKRKWFEQQVKRRTEELASRYRDSKELMAAMLSGELGAGVQARAGVFFRNKKMEELSPEDLRTFIEDCELLENLPSESDSDTDSDQ